MFEEMQAFIYKLSNSHFRTVPVPPLEKEEDANNPWKSTLYVHACEHPYGY